MKMKSAEDTERTLLCDKARILIDNGNLDECEQLLCDAMSRYPHIPEPNNLLGILMEKRGNHILAMKHFRAAWALDPAYRPARHNLEWFGSFFSVGTLAFDENDCPIDPITDRFAVENDTRGVGHAVKVK